MKNKLLFVPLIVLLGCDPLGRLTGTSTKHEDAQPVKPMPVTYEGNFQGSNFVEIDNDGAKEVSVYIKHKGEWIPLDGYDTAQKTKDPYYVIVKNEVIFENTPAEDLYSIRVTK